MILMLACVSTMGVEFDLSTHREFRDNYSDLNRSGRPDSLIILENFFRFMYDTSLVVCAGVDVVPD